MTYGYARCSTNETKQDVERQVRELKAAGAEAIFFEYEHGDAAVKCRQEEMFRTASSGDTVMVGEVSRLSRSTKQLCEIIEVVKAKKLRIVILGSITIDCRDGSIDPMSAAFIQIAAVFAELERSLISGRIKSALAAKAASGVRLGRAKMTKDDVPAIFLKHYPSFKSGVMNLSELARVCNRSRPTIYRYLELVEREGG